MFARKQRRTSRIIRQGVSAIKDVLPGIWKRKKVLSLPHDFTCLKVITFVTIYRCPKNIDGAYMYWYTMFCFVFMVTVCKRYVIVTKEYLLHFVYIYVKIVP